MNKTNDIMAIYEKYETEVYENMNINPNTNSNMTGNQMGNQTGNQTGNENTQQEKNYDELTLYNYGNRLAYMVIHTLNKSPNLPWKKFDRSEQEIIINTIIKGINRWFNGP